MGKDPIKNYSENTLKSFEKAFEIGLNYIECDIRKSKDNELLIFHDEDLERTIKNEKGKLKNYTSKEIKFFKTKENNERIPTLEELLILIKKNENNRLFIELKENDCHFELINLIEKYKIETQINIVSFHFNFLKEIRKLNSTIEIGFLIKNNFIEKDLIVDLKELNISNLGIGWWILNDENIENFNKNFKCWVWNPTTKNEILKILNFNKIIGMGSNDPKMTKEVIDEWILIN